MPPAAADSTLHSLRGRQTAQVALAMSAQLWSALAGWPVESAVVRKVPDGDGLKLLDRRRVRYLGINAPEVSTWDGGPEPFALQAKELNQRLVEGQQVMLVGDPKDVDAYGRLLRYVFRRSLSVNAILLLTGLARLDFRRPDDHGADTLRQCEAYARQARLGMWGT